MTCAQVNPCFDQIPKRPDETLTCADHLGCESSKERGTTCDEKIFDVISTTDTGHSSWLLASAADRILSSTASATSDLCANWAAGFSRWIPGCSGRHAQWTATGSSETSQIPYSSGSGAGMGGLSAWIQRGLPSSSPCSAATAWSLRVI